MSAGFAGVCHRGFGVTARSVLAMSQNRYGADHYVVVLIEQTL